MALNQAMDTVKSVYPISVNLILIVMLVFVPKCPFFQGFIANIYL